MTKRRLPRKLKKIIKRSTRAYRPICIPLSNGGYWWIDGSGRIHDSPIYHLTITTKSKES